jgi:ankyrin repeat protein
LLEKCAANVDGTDTSGNTSLHVAAKEGHSDVVKYLLEMGNAEVGKSNKYGDQALHWTTVQGNLDILQYLVEKHNVCLNTVNLPRRSAPLHMACCKGHMHIVEYIMLNGYVEKDSKRRAVLIAIDKQNINLVKYLVERGGFEVNGDYYPKAYEVFHAAIRKGDLNIVKYLVQHGANVEASTIENVHQTTIFKHHHSNRYGGYEIVDEDVWTTMVTDAPLRLAASNGHLTIVKYLVEICKANVEATDSNGASALFFCNHLSIVEYLVEQAGANICAKNSSGQTP